MTDQILNELTVVEPDLSVYMAPNGLKLKLKKVSRFVVVDATKKFKMPSVPVIYDKDKDREIENPNDPDYIAELRSAKFEQGMLAISVYLTLGTEVLELPANVSPVDATDWSEDLESLGITIPIKGRARYVAWLKYYCLTDDEFNALAWQVMKFSGTVREEDVKQAMESFRGDEGQSGDITIPST